MRLPHVILLLVSAVTAFTPAPWGAGQRQVGTAGGPFRLAAKRGGRGGRGKAGRQPGKGRGKGPPRASKPPKPSEEPLAIETVGFGAPQADPGRPFGPAAGLAELRPTDFSLDERKDVSFLGGFATDLPSTEVPEVAFIGRSNVGKSSFLNALEGGNKAVAIVSKTPGRTRQINLFQVANKAGKPLCVFADLPGYGYAKLAKGRQRTISRSLRRYFEGRRQLQLAVLLVDSRRDAQDSDADLAAAFEELDVPYVVVATKVDKLKKGEVERNLKAIREGMELPDNLPIPASVVTGEGVRLVWSIIQGVCAGAVLRDVSDTPLLAEDDDDERGEVGLDDDEDDDDDEEDFYDFDDDDMDEMDPHPFRS
eukprot:scaffold834_cov244-Pinguiococcus_pyrenoidosus.AAC.14